MNEDSRIIALDDDGNELNLLIMDSVIYRDTMYVIAIEDDETIDETEEAVEATILKQVKSEDNYITYSFLEDEEEFNTVMEMFEEHDEYEFEGE